MTGISPAHTILARAQESVDRWATSPTQSNFALAMESESWVYWSPSPANAAEREIERPSHELLMALIERVTRAH